MIGGQTCMQKIEHKAVVVVIMATAFLFTFSQFLLITAYPTIMDEFGVNATQVQWLTTAFLLDDNRLHSNDRLFIEYI